MLRGAITTLAAVVTLVMIVKIVVAPARTATDTEAMKASVQNAMSTYDLHVHYPAMKNLATQKIPQP
jgi:hypothetical protein